MAVDLVTDFKKGRAVVATLFTVAAFSCWSPPGAPRA
jgi:hypothetical protein